MKICPKCSEVFNDDTLSFCLQDGTLLLDAASQPTVVIGERATVRTRRRIWPLVLLAVFAAALGGAVVTAAVFLFFKDNNAIATNPSTRSTSQTPTPRPLQTPTRSDTPVREAATPVPDPSPAYTQGASDEVTPISWSTAANGFRNEVGMTYRFECSPDGTTGIVWGSDIYTADSSICTAAVHAGVITVKTGGIVEIEYRPGRLTYGSTVRNGVQSHNYGEFGKSFVVRKPGEDRKN